VVAVSRTVRLLTPFLALALAAPSPPSDTGTALKTPVEDDDLTPAAPGEPEPARPIAVFHDNQAPAGELRDGVLKVGLRAMEADWRPYGTEEAGKIMYAFAEEDGDPLIPGPYLQAPLGSRMEVTIENTLDSILVVHGFGERKAEPLERWYIEPGKTETKSFVADAEGTFYYWARAGADPVALDRGLGGNQRVGVFMSGALVITGPEMPEPIDRVMILGVHVHGLGPAILTINGRPWPYTERLDYTMGQTVRWRLVNASGRGHPMHLHGFFYDVDAKGDIDESTVFWNTRKRKAVTEEMAVGETMAISWTPDRPGGWIFHCHISGHVGPNHYPLNEPTTRERNLRQNILGNPHHAPENHVVEGMGGLMMGMYVHPSPDWRPDERPRRQMRLVINSDSIPAPPGTPLENRSPYRRTFSPILQVGPNEPPPDSVQLPGSTLVLREGEPTSVWVVNRTPEPTQIHWHGLEIESPFDGVVGVGGYDGMPTPPIMPADSFEMRFTPPRPGSFMYHTHMSDVRQQGAGLYGAFVVVPEDEEFDPEHDKVLLLGLSPSEQGVLLNGKTDLPPMTLREGETYRFRFMNITLGAPGTFELLRNGSPVTWTLVAKDGADLPEHQRKSSEARQLVRVGETYDVLFTPRRLPPAFFGPGGEYVLEISSLAGIQARQPIEIVPSGG
jgi:FtsP/CotA-like multicopper oxidase with cupredoxin domain